MTKYIPVFHASLLMAHETKAASCVAPARKVRKRLRLSFEKYAVYLLLLCVDFSKTVKSEIEFKIFQEKKTIDWNFFVFLQRVLERMYIICPIATRIRTSDMNGQYQRTWSLRIAQVSP